MSSLTCHVGIRSCFLKVIMNYFNSRSPSVFGVKSDLLAIIGLCFSAAQNIATQFNVLYKPH